MINVQGANDHSSLTRSVAIILTNVPRWIDPVGMRWNLKRKSADAARIESGIRIENNQFTGFLA
jgi:hypothetical protein